jgi:hypothetical protein
MSPQLTLPDEDILSYLSPRAVNLSLTPLTTRAGSRPRVNFLVNPGIVHDVHIVSGDAAYFGRFGVS